MSKKDKKEKEILHLWQDRMEKAKSAYAPKMRKMVGREEQYKGTHDMRPLTDGDVQKDGNNRKTNHVWNITKENIESEVDSNILPPKVIAVRREDEYLAIMAEHMLRNELERLPMEKINDIAGRICLIQGGTFYLIEWDESKKTHTTSGANFMQAVHPQRMIPQDGVEELEAMDHFFLLLPQTKTEVKRRYGVDVSAESEEMPELRGVGSEGSEGTAGDVVTLVQAYFKNDRGGIGRMAFVGDTVCEYKEDCMSRVQRVCKKCGQTEADSVAALAEPTVDGNYPSGGEEKPKRGHCSYCGGSSWEEKTVKSFRVHIDEMEEMGVRKQVVDKLKALRGYGAVQMPTEGGFFAPAEEFAMRGEMTPGETEMGVIARDLAQGAFSRSFRQSDFYIDIPYYKPKEYPLVLQRNVSSYGEFLGESDCDAIKDQQNTVNRLSQKVIDRIVKAGKKIALPDDTKIVITTEDNDVWRMSSQDLAQVRDFDFVGNLQFELGYMEQVYQESRRVLGITDSFQGRKDATATSGKAKEFAAAQSAGRLESKRIMKKAAMEEIYKKLFQNMLAYCSEKRPVRSENDTGNTQYEEWCSYAFLDIDEAGELYWNDNFLFSCDNSGGLASNREAMWQEMTAHLQSGAFGNPAEIQTLIIYWAQMQLLHYPGAGKIKQLLEQRAKEQKIQQAQMAQMQMQMQQAGAQGAPMM